MTEEPRPAFDIRWRRDLHQVPHALLARPDGIVLVTERRNRLVRLDPRTGQRVWEACVDDTWGHLAVAGQTCFYLSQGGMLESRRLQDGLLIWQEHVGRMTGRVIVHDGVLLIGGWRGYTALRARDVRDGRPLWEGSGLPEAHLGVPGLGGVLLAAVQSPTVHLLRVSDGHPEQSWALPSPVMGGDQTVAMAADEVRALLLTAQGDVITLDRHGHAAPLWKHSRPVAAHAPLRRHESLWITELHGLAVVDLISNTTRTVELPEPPSAAPLLTETGALLACQDGQLLRLDDDARTVLRSQVSRRTRGLLASESGLVLIPGKGELLCVAT